MADASNPATVSGLSSVIRLNVEGSPDIDGVVSARAELDMSNVEFSALGDYKFVIRETDSADPLNYPVAEDHEYYAYVSVRNKLDSNGRPTGEYVAAMPAQVRDHDMGDKVEANFKSEAQRSYITIKNEVSGNLANTEDYFLYRVDIMGAEDGDEFTISGQDETVVYNGETIDTRVKMIIGLDNYVYLKHGQEVTIGKNGDLYELPIGIRYSVVEVDANGYVQYVDGEAGDTSAEKTVENDAQVSSNRVDFLNHKEGSILTGIVMSVWPYALALGLVGGLVSTRGIIKKKQCRAKCSR